MCCPVVGNRIAVLVRLLVALLLPLVGFNATTTVVCADAYTYDGPQLAHVEVDATLASGSALSQLSRSMAGGGERSLVILGSSTTPVSAGIATNTRLDASTLKMTKTVEQHLTEYAKDGRLSRPYGGSILTLQEIIDAATPVADPQGVPGACRWDVAGTFRGKSGTWELVIDINTGTILHFLFK